MYIRKPQPITATPVGKVCPVCGYVSYSRGGVHPQCSSLLVDRSLLAAQRRDLASEMLAKGKSGVPTENGRTRP